MRPQGQFGVRTDPDSGTRKKSFLTSFYAFLNNVVMDKFVARELPDKTHISNFSEKKFFFIDFDDFPFSLQYTQ